MKKYNFILIVLSLVLISCKEQKTITLTQQPIPQNGNVSLAFKKTQIFKPVKIICALLKNNTDLLVKTLNTTDYGSAEIEFSNVPIGTWKLKIDAISTDNIILYSGSVDVSVRENQFTNVNPAFDQKSSGKDGITRSVTWTQGSRWIDFSSIPLLKSQNTQYDGRGVGYPFVIFDDSSYKMWYLNIKSLASSTESNTSIGYATSKNGLVWQHYSHKPVLTSTAGTWDAFIIGHGSILKDDTGYKLYYDGRSSNTHIPFSIGLATSFDGIHWKKKPEPILTGTNSWDYSIGVKGVLKVKNKYYMYYGSGPASSIGLATSVDGITWTRYTNNPIINPTEPWEGGGIGYASVIYDEGKFKMVYSNNGYSASFGYAISADGIHWIKDASNPIFAKEKTKNLWAGIVGYPSLTKVGDKLMIYYTGMESGGSNMRIGVAIKN